MTHELNVVICGCTINSASYIRKHLEHLYVLNGLFKTVDIVLYENDSSDNTVEVLKDLEKEGKIKLITERNIKATLRARTAIIAHGRNKLVNYVNSCDKYDFMIMIDLDTVLSQSVKGSIENAFKFNTDDWDVLLGNCQKRYYDIWALRINKTQWTALHQSIWQWCLDYDCWDMIIHRRQQGKDERLLHTRGYQKCIPSHFPLIPVESGFNGIGIYKTSVIKNCSYNGFASKCTCINYEVSGKCIAVQCEHVPFHNMIRNKNKGRLFICPALLVHDQQEHWQ